MRTKQLKLGTWISAGSPVVTELISQLGFDWLLFDLEHGMMNESNLLANMQATKGNVKIIVRIGECNSSLIARILDWGADGIMMPHVNTPSDAERVVKVMRYPPHGERGYSSSCRAFGFGSCAPENISEWQPPLFIAQIESYTGMINAEKIASVEGVDMLFTGPADLKLDLSLRHKNERVDFNDAICRIASSAAKYSCGAGILVRDFSQIQKFHDAGYGILALSSDLGMIRKGYNDILETLKGIV